METIDKMVFYDHWFVREDTGGSTGAMTSQGHLKRGSSATTGSSPGASYSKIYKGKEVKDDKKRRYLLYLGNRPLEVDQRSQEPTRLPI